MSKKPTIEFCKDYAKNRGYKLDEIFYINRDIKMKFIHLEDNCGNVFFMRWGNFKSGQGCPKCAIKINSNKSKLKIDDCKIYALERGYEILENIYIDNSTKMNFRHLDEKYRIITRPWRISNTSNIKINLKNNMLKRTVFL